ncbi:Cupin, RmlC-type [Senna tora]|uniref:Cupin, RmlC-type n=1 Tax=Senna tora TaxID=362788 RepID=A0A834VXA2_9FABA|nr:Cupin, RmlC-type [Senna tora]
MSNTTPARRVVYANNTDGPTISVDDNAFGTRPSFLASLLQFLHRPHQSLPFLAPVYAVDFDRSSEEDVVKANLVRLNGGIPSQIAKDERGWAFDPLSIAHANGISGGTSSCGWIEVGEIRAGKMRGNHRHHNCNQTFVIWGAATKFRVEKSNNNIEGEERNGYVEVIVARDEVGVGVSTSGKAHAFVNIDPFRSTFFITCQECNPPNINASTTTYDINVWKDL